MLDIPHIPRILNRLLVLVQEQEPVLDPSSETRITVLENSQPPGFREECAKYFKFLILESNSPELKQLFDESANKLGTTTRYFRLDQTVDDQGFTRIILACPAGNSENCFKVWSEDRRIIKEHKGAYQQFKKLLRRLPPMPYVTIVGFSLKTELGFIGTIGAINESLRAAEKKMVKSYQEGNMWYLVVGTSQKAIIGKAA